MVGFKLQTQTLIILFWLDTLILSANYDINTERFICRTTPNDLCQNTSCTTRLVKRNLTYINFSCHLPEVADNVMIRTILYYKFNVYRKFLVDVEENLCDFFDNKKTSVLKTLMPVVLKESNIHACPLQGDVIVKDLNINNEFSPSGLPAGRYRLDTILSTKSRLITEVNLYLTIKPRGTAKLEMG